MGADGDGRDEEPTADLRSRQTFSQQLEDLPLALGQIDATPFHERQPAAPPTFPELVDHERNEPARESGLAVEDTAERVRKTRRVGVLQQVAGGARAQRI